jgi:basic membrane protein A and related proteins
MGSWLIRAALLVAALALLAAGCGGDNGEDAIGDDGDEQERALTVALVTDIGGLDDRSFNQLAYEGLQRAESELGIEARVVQSQSDADYIPNLSSLAEDGVDLIIGVGFLLSEAIGEVAAEFPDQRFAIIDVPIEAVPGSPDNVRGLVFREEQGGYLAGYLAALVQEADMDRLNPDAMVVSSVAGQKIPPVDRYIAGFQAGARAANPDVQTLNAYSQDFVDQAKCKEIALEQINRGSDVIIQLAGACGLGALDAANERGVWGMGADADQSFLGEHIIASALKKVDVSVYDTIELVLNDDFTGGENTVFDIENEGVGIGGFHESIPEEIVERVREVERQIHDGEITDIPTEVP